MKSGEGNKASFGYFLSTYIDVTFLFYILYILDIFRLDSHTNNTVAIKIINVEESESTVEQLQAEVSQLAQCDSRYITRLFCSYAHEGHLYIIMEYVDGGSVLDLLFADVLDEASIAIIVRETLKGLQYVLQNTPS